VAWSGPFSASRSLLGFPSRELGRQRGRPVVTRVTVSLSTPFARRRSWGFPDCPFAGLLPLTGRRRVSARPDPRAVGRTIGRGVLAARSAGPVETFGRLVAFVVARPRCYAPPLNENDHESGARWVGRSRIDRFGFWVFSFPLLPSAIVPRRRSSFPARARPALGFSLSQV